MVIAAKSIESNFKSAKNWLVTNYSPNLRTYSNYDDFKKAFSANACDRTGKKLPGVKGSFVYNGTVDWEPGDDSQKNTEVCSSYSNFKDGAIIFINGDLNINANLDLGRPVVFIVKNNVTIAPSVTEVKGMFVVDGNFNTGTTGNQATDVQLTINGSVAAALTPGAKLNLERKYSVAAGNQPSEKIFFDPKYLYILADFIGTGNTSTEETTP